MKFTRQHIPDVVLIQPHIFKDDRGHFLETYRQDQLDDFVGYKVAFCQDNESRSSRGVLRGLHYQVAPYAQSKLVRVVAGAILDVAVDIRPASPTFMQHVSVQLDSEEHAQLFIPRGFAHGFVVLSDTATVVYKVDNYFNPAADRGLAFDAPGLDIDWMFATADLVLSDKDQRQPRELPAHEGCDY